MNTAQKKTYFISILFISVIVALFYFENIYLVDNLKLLSSEVLSAKEKVSTIEQRNKNIGEVRKNYSNIQNEIGIISDSIADSDYEKVVDLFVELEDVAKENGVELKKSPSSQGQETLGDGLAATYLNIEVLGEFDQLMNFLLYLDNFKYYVDLNNVNITNQVSKDLGEEFSSSISLKGDLKVYLKENKK